MRDEQPAAWSSMSQGQGEVLGAPSSSAEEVRRRLAAALQQQNDGDTQGAIRSYNQLLTHYPFHPDACNNLAVLLKSEQRLSAAVACLRRAILAAPHSAVLYSNLGNLLWMALEFDAAKAAFERALELDANRPEIFHNYGLLNFSLGDYRQAIACYDRSLALRPGNRLAMWDRALALLAGGDLVSGFAAYDIRFELDDSTRNFDRQLRNVHSVPLPLWQGEDLAGKTLYVYAEQGLGDTIQFARFLTLAARRGARVIFDCQPELMRLIANLPGIAELRPLESPLPQANFHLPLMSLPHRLGTTLATIPAATSLVLPPVVIGPRISRPAGTRLAIGITWAGRPQHNNDRNRSMALEHFLDLCDLPGVALYSLQKGPRAQDIAALGAQALIHDLGPQIRDFADTARLIMQLDLVISIDTALVHLAGALARPGFVLLAYTPDWRWLNHRDDSPWYPTLRLFRQQRVGDWKGVIQRVRETLRAKLDRG